MGCSSSKVVTVDEKIYEGREKRISSPRVGSKIFEGRNSNAERVIEKNDAKNKTENIRQNMNIPKIPGSEDENTNINGAEGGLNIQLIKIKTNDSEYRQGSKEGKRDSLISSEQPHQVDILSRKINHKENNNEGENARELKDSTLFNDETINIKRQVKNSNLPSFQNSMIGSQSHLDIHLGRKSSLSDSLNLNNYSRNIGNIFSAENSSQTVLNHKVITITLNASKFEAMYPLWVEEGVEVLFEVEGTWASDDKAQLTDAEGYITPDDDNEFSNTFNKGALVGRVFGGDYFAIKNGLIYTSSTSGPLFLKMFLNDIRNNPRGFLKIKLYGALDMTFDEIERKIGWDNSTLDTSLCTGVNLAPLEKSLLIYINKIRTNPILFAQQYLENVRYLTNSTNNLYNELTTFTTRLMPLKLSEELCLICKETMANNNFDRSVLSTEVLEQKINLKYKRNGLKLSVKRHEDNKALSVLIKLIITSKIKHNILDENFCNIGLSIKPPVANMNKYNTTLLIFETEQIEEEKLKDIEHICCDYEYDNIDEGNDFKHNHTKIQKTNFALMA